MNDWTENFRGIKVPSGRDLADVLEAADTGSDMDGATDPDLSAHIPDDVVLLDVFKDVAARLAEVAEALRQTALTDESATLAMQRAERDIRARTETPQATLDRVMPHTGKTPTGERL